MDRRASRSLTGAIVFAAAALASGAQAIGVRSPVPVAVRARLDIRLTADETAVPAWNLASRSPADSSRFMADATVGGSRSGRFYLKGVASWNQTDDALGRVAFRLAQGEYHYAWRDTSRTGVDVCAFGDERRFFTGELGTPIVDDDRVERFAHRLGIRVDGSRGDLGAMYVAAALDEGPSSRVLQLGTARVAGPHAFAAVSYLHNAPEQGDDHAIAKAEAAACVRWATMVASYEQSGFGSGVFLPGGSWDELGSGYRAAAPENSATFAEVRANRVAVGADGWLTATLHYDLAGADYVDDLAARRPGTVARGAWLDWSHRRYALDARLAWREETRFEFLEATRHSLELSAHAHLRDNSDMLVRAGVARDDAHDGEDAGLVHVGYGRGLQRFSGRVDAMVDRIGVASVASAGVEGRVNWNATSALYLRWIVRDAPPWTQAVFARLEFRPTRRTWFTVGYGRAVVGDDPYFLEENDWAPAPDSDGVVTFSVRGDL
jgi:hypothetical protein